MLLEIAVPPQVKGIVEIEVETLITAQVVSAYRFNESNEGQSCRWNLNPQFLSCFNFPDDFQKITLWRFNGKFTLEVEYEEHDSDSNGNNVPGTGFLQAENLDVLAVREVQNFPSVQE